MSELALKDFIRQTLLDISGGVHEANVAYMKDSPSVHNPFLLPYSGGEKKERGIDFDVALTTKAATETVGQAKVGIYVLQLSKGGQSHDTHENVSRVTFSVMIHQHLA
jgi:hypothetical protein